MYKPQIKMVIREQYYIIEGVLEKNNFSNRCMFAIFARHGKTKERIRKKKKQPESTYTRFANCNERIFLCALPALPTYIRSSFYGDKHQKVPRKLNTCTFFYLFIFSYFFSSLFLHVRTHTFHTYRYVLHTLNNTRETRCFSPYFHSSAVIQVHAPYWQCRGAL